jgi:radical SAM superfamily enzyme
VSELRKRNIRTVVHLILGLPGETRDMMLESVRYVSSIPGLFGMKLHLMNLVKGSSMAHDIPDYVSFPDIDSYVELVTDCLEIIPSSVTIHRLTGDVPRKLLIAPEWSYKKRTILNMINSELKRRNTFQGAKLQ